MTAFGVGFIVEGIKFDEVFGVLTSSVLMSSYGLASSCVISKQVILKHIRHFFLASRCISQILLWLALESRIVYFMG